MGEEMAKEGESNTEGNEGTEEETPEGAQEKIMGAEAELEEDREEEDKESIGDSVDDLLHSSSGDSAEADDLLQESSSSDSGRAAERDPPRWGQLRGRKRRASPPPASLSPTPRCLRGRPWGCPPTCPVSSHHQKLMRMALLKDQAEFLVVDAWGIDLYEVEEDDFPPPSKMARRSSPSPEPQPDNVIAGANEHPDRVTLDEEPGSVESQDEADVTPIIEENQKINDEDTHQEC